MVTVNRLPVACRPYIISKKCLFQKFNTTTNPFLDQIQNDLEIPL